MSPGGMEHRRAPRLRMDLGFSFWLALEGPGQRRPARSLNLSESGMAFESPVEIQQHDILSLEISFPGQMRLVQLGARVLYCRALAGKPGFEARCLFLDPSPEETLAIRAALAPLLDRAKLPGQVATAVVEERKDQRAAVNLKVRFREVGDHEVALFMENRTYMDFDTLLQSRFFPNMVSVFTEDISASGLKLLGEKAFPEGRKLALELRLPSVDLPVRALAVVMWAKPALDLPGMHWGGLRFLAIRKEDALAVEAFVKRGKEKES